MTNKLIKTAMKKVVITGANGFFGRNLSPVIDKLTEDLILIDKPPFLWDGSGCNSAWHHNKEVFYADIADDIHQLKTLVYNADVVIHLANRARIQPSWNEYEDYYRINISATQKFFNLCQQMNAKKFIYFSSSSVYGNNGTVRQKETDQLMPTNPYGVSKMAAEWALHVQASKGSTELVVVRPFTMYGDFMDIGPNALVISKFLNNSEKGFPLFLEGSGSQRRDFVHVSDAIDGLFLIIQHSENGDVFNLGSGKSVSVKQIADIISPHQIIIPERTGAVYCTEADIGRLSALGYSPKIDVLSWLTNEIEKYKMHNHNHQ